MLNASCCSAQSVRFVKKWEANVSPVFSPESGYSLGEKKTRKARNPSTVLLARSDRDKRIESLTDPVTPRSTLSAESSG